MYVLHLTSWYPSKVNLWIGDFVQRHIWAISSFYKCVIIHVVLDKNLNRGQQSIEIFVDNGVVTYIGYFRPRLNFLHNIAGLLLGYRIVKIVLAKYGRPSLVHVHVMHPMIILATKIKRTYKIPFVITEHSTFYHQKYFSVLQKLYLWLIKKCYKNASYFLPVSEHLGRRLIELKFMTIPTLSVPNVVSKEFKYTDRKIMSSLKLLHVSSLFDEHKNIRGILSACQILQSQGLELELTLVGMHDYYGTKKLVNRIVGPNNWLYLKGPLSHEEVALEMQRHNAFVLFSRYENLPCVLLEALVSGLPCISSNVGGCSELINDKNGILVDSENIGQLVKAIEHVFHNMHNYSNRIIALKAKSMYGNEVVGSTFAKIYNGVM